MTKRHRQADDAPPQRRNRARPVGEDVTLVGREAFVRSGFTDSALILHWAEIVGSEVARMARPLKLAEGAGGGVLTLKAEPAASVFLQHETRTYATRSTPIWAGKPSSESASWRAVSCRPTTREKHHRRRRLPRRTIPPANSKGRRS